MVPSDTGQRAHAIEQLAEEAGGSPASGSALRTAGCA